MISNKKVASYDVITTVITLSNIPTNPIMIVGEILVLLLEATLCIRSSAAMGLIGLAGATNIWDKVLPGVRPLL